VNHEKNPTWVSDLGILDRSTGIEKARVSGQWLQDAAQNALIRGTDQTTGEIPLTTGHMVLMGLATRAIGLHDASVSALENDNPFAAFTLIRAYAENAAWVVYAIEHPKKVDKLLGLHGTPRSPGTVTNYVKQGKGRKRFGAFREVYSELSEYAHPMSKSILASTRTQGENGFHWSSIPAFKSDGDFLTASAWIVEFAEANAHLFAEFADSQGW
jgi:hypothetical protein